MRPLTTTLVACALFAALPTTALAHQSHGGCTSTSLTGPVVHVDRYQTAPCRGVTVSTEAECMLGIPDVHALNAHVLILRGHGCQTGVILA